MNTSQHTLRHGAYVLAAFTLLTGTAGLTGCSGKKDKSAQAGKTPGIGDPGGSTPVQAAVVQNGTISALVPVTGDLKALQDVQISAKTSGRVTFVVGREGMPVKAGELLVQQDATDLQANVQQAQANVASAIAKLSQARTNYTIGVVNAKQAVALARAQVAAANQNYLKVKGGSRPQQVLQGKNQVELAKANLDNALTVLNRNKSLYAQGALAKADLDTAQTNYDVQVQTYQNAQASLSLTVEGSQVEDIAAALAQLQQQQSNLANSIANEQNIEVRRDDIVAAQAAVAQAKATLAFNQQQVANASLHSPIDGIIAERDVEPGQIASPGSNLLRVVDVHSMYYEPSISETDFAATQVGNPVQIAIDALPGKTYLGKVKTIYPATSGTDRTFGVRVTLDDPGGELRPGMFARGDIVTKVARGVPVVPATALIPVAAPLGFVPNSSSDAPIAESTQSPPQQIVVVGPGNVARIRPVKVGIETQQQAQILSGLEAGERIVTVGQTGLREGDKLAIIDDGDTADKAAQAGDNSAPAPSS